MFKNIWEIKMIRNQWYVILESSEVKPGKMLGVTRMGERLLMWRDASGQVVCMHDICPHRGAQLSKGKIIHDHIQCPFHGFEFDHTGQCTLIPANGKQSIVPKVFQASTYPTSEDHGFIRIWWGESIPELPPVYFFDFIGADMSYATLRDHWKTHYSRAIENQLDVVHLPFIHHNTIGRGHRTLVDGPVYEIMHDKPGYYLLNLWVYNRVDDGAPPRKASEMSAPTRRPFLQFIFPNLWQNWISDDIRIVIAFAPIDDENTMMYIRYYQNTVRIPILREITHGIGNLANLIIERQDKRVVETQLPKRSGLHIGEKMIQGDGPVIGYRRLREELKNTDH
jgi:phenylpropionate dioxygenase-like ring-hydroxylating dioxygenase large terminal subunit